MTTQYNSIMLSISTKTFRRGAVCSLVALVMAGILSGSVHASSGFSADFCHRQPVYSYLAPLGQVSLSPRFDSSGELGVGPASLRILLPKEQLVPIGKGTFGARGYLSSQSGQARPLRWWVVSRLERVQSSGPAKIVKHKQQFVQNVSGFGGRQFGFSSKGMSSGLYRLTVEIQNAAGKVLEKHQEAFRALRARSDLRLAKSFNSLAPGESGLIRVDNYGTVEARYGANYRLWSADGDEVPVNPIFGNVLYLLSAGMAGPCITFTVPGNLMPGEYRVGSVASDLIHRNQMLTAAFSVR